MSKQNGDAKPADKVAGFLEIGFDINRQEVTVNGDKAAVDAEEKWHIVFSAAQAERFAQSILTAVQQITWKENH